MTLLQITPADVRSPKTILRRNARYEFITALTSRRRSFGNVRDRTGDALLKAFHVFLRVGEIAGCRGNVIVRSLRFDVVTELPSVNLSRTKP